MIGRQWTERLSQDQEQYMLIPSRLLGSLIYLVINEYFSNAEI